ncbi:MAG: hypothetical protein JSR96_06130 [Proteobacteria bacterium]|nr:hypothetical protein [Pseudomonadota bacterium]
MPVDTKQRECSATFRVEARKDPATLVRILNHFAQIGLVPDRVVVVQALDHLILEVAQQGLEEKRGQIIAEKMRSSVLVLSVEAAFRRVG